MQDGHLGLPDTARYSSSPLSYVALGPSGFGHRNHNNRNHDRNTNTTNTTHTHLRPTHPIIITIPILISIADPPSTPAILTSLHITIVITIVPIPIFIFTFIFLLLRDLLVVSSAPRGPAAAPQPTATDELNNTTLPS